MAGALTIEQQKAMALARARRLRVQAQAQNLDAEIGQRSAILPGAPTDGPKGQETVQLRPASPTMFQGVDPQSEQRMREEYARSPDTTTGFGGFQKYQGQNIPPHDPYNRLRTPEENVQSTIERVTSLPGGIYNMGRNIGQTATSIGEGAGILPHGSTETYSKNVPSYEPKTPTGGFLTGVTEIVGGAVAGGGPVGLVAKGASGALRLFKAAAKYTAATGGAVASVDEDVAPLFTGPNAEFGNLVGAIALDEKGNFNQKYLDRRMNLFIEAFALAKPAELAARGVVGLGRFVLWDATIKNWKDWRNLDVKKRQAAMDIFTELAKYNPLDSTENLNAQKQRLAQRMRENGFVDIASDVPGIDPVHRQRSTMESIIAKPDPNMDQAAQAEEFAKASGLQTDTLSKGAPKLEATLDTPSKEIENVSNQTREVFGGDESVNRGREAILRDADQEVQSGTNRVNKLEDQLANSNRNVRDLQEEVIPPEARTEDIDLGLRQKSNEVTDEIVQKHNEIKGGIVEESNEKFDEVRKSQVPAAMEEFNAVVKEVEDFLPADIKKLIDDADGTYGYLKKVIEPELSAEINDLFSNHKGRIAKKLIKLRDNIKRDQKAALYDNEGQGQVTAHLADEADRNFKETVAPLRQGLSEDLTDITKKNRQRPIDLVEESRAKVKSVFKNPDRDLSTKQVLDVIDDEKLRSDFVTYNIAEELNDEIASKGISGLDLGRVTKLIRTYQPLIGDAGSKRLENLLNSINTKSKNIDELSKTVAALKKETEAARTKIYDKELKNFFDDFGDPIKNADEIFIRYMNDDRNAIGGINKLSARLKNQQTADGPVLGDALKSSFTKFAQKKFFETGRTSTGARNINNNFLDNSEKFFEIGDKIYGKDSTVMNMYRALADEANLAVSTRGAKKVSPVTPLNQADVEAKKGIDFVITQIFGPLSRWGARLRSGSTNLLSSKSSKKMSIEARDFVMANPEEAAKLIDAEIARNAGKLTKEGRLDMYKYFVLNGILNREDYSEEEFMKLTSDASDQTEKALGGSVNGKK